jgi:glycosyltransferase involved in cell wall biosynthesis
LRKTVSAQKSANWAFKPRFGINSGRYPILKIGLDATPLVKLQGGIGYYIFYLLDALIPLHPTCQFLLYTFSQIPHFKRYPNVVFRSLPLRVGSHALWGQTQLPLALGKDNLDLFLGMTQSIPLLHSKCKSLLLIHDFVYKLYPHTVSRLKCALASTLSPAMIQKTDYIVCNSHGTAAKLLSFYKRDTDLILTPPLKTAISYQKPDERLTSLGLFDKGYFFSVGTLEPRKNWIGLIERFLTIETPFPLVIAGSGGWKNKQLLKQLHSLQTAFPKRIRCLGHVDDATLSLLFSSARYTLCLSHYEGYGMPIAESRICRTPVICFDQPEMREAAENDALFITSLEDNAFARALQTDPKPPSACSYPTNQEKAIALSKLL